MQAIVDFVVEKTGLAPEQAESAVNAVLGFVRERLPEPMQGMLNSVLGGESGEGGGGGDLLSSIGGMFGGGDNN